MTASPKISRVSIAVVWHGDEVLVQRRQQGQTYAGYWEFPGGKIQCGETPGQAVCRELLEEVGITAKTALPWIKRRYSYPHGEVELNFFQITDFDGAPFGAEGQAWQWAKIAEPPSPLLPANKQLWKWLALPAVCAITAAEIFGVDDMLRRLDVALSRGLRLVQLRDKNLPPAERHYLATEAAVRCRRSRALLLINDDEELARLTAADGVHLSSKKLAAISARPDFLWVAASCHQVAEATKAAALDLDFIVLSPVAKTLTHVNAAPLGWQGFAAIAADVGMPVYALGGMTATDIAMARAHHAHGVGMMRQAWED